MRKYLLTIATAMLLVVGCGDSGDSNGGSTSVTNYTIDNGTWLILTAQGLKDFATQVKTDNATNAKLMNDINLEGNANNQWEAIGTNSNKYTGVFDGNNKTISGLYIDKPTVDSQGLFGFSSSTIKNVKISSPTITGQNDVGSAAGWNGGTVENITVIGGTIKGNNDVGGVVGVNSTGGTVTASHNTGAVSGTNYTGGVVGWNNGGTVTAVYNTGEVNGRTNVGGIVGNDTGGTVTASYNTGKVSGTSEIGGVVGINEGKVTASYNTGNVSGESSGGIVGRNEGGTVTAVYNTGSVTNTSGSSYIGGVVGWNTGSVDTAYYTTSNNSGINGIGADTTSGVKVTNVSGVASDSDILASVLNGVIGNATHIFVAGANGPTLQANSADCINPTNDHADNNGTWEIYTADGLIALRSNLSQDAKLMCNINLGGSASEWTPIGTEPNSYTGVFDGDNKTISGLYINKPTANHQGLFGASSGSIKNLIISNPTITARRNVGGVVGYNHISSKNENVAVIGGTITGEDSVGGIVGIGRGTIIASYNTSKVNGENNIGGIIGLSDGLHIACYNTGDVTGIRNVGGVVGFSEGSVTASYNTGNVSGETSGGIAGWNEGGTVNTAYFINGKVEGGNVGIGTDTTSGANITSVSGVASVSDILASVLNGAIDSSTTNYRFDTTDIYKFVIP